MAREMRPFIDSDGDMTLHGREGGVAVFTFKDDSGQPRDMTEASVSFQTPNFSKDLEPGPESDQMTLTLEASELPNPMNKRLEYIILDSSGTVPHVICDGKLTVIGWM